MSSCPRYALLLCISVIPLPAGLLRVLPVIHRSAGSGISSLLCRSFLFGILCKTGRYAAHQRYQRVFQPLPDSRIHPRLCVFEQKSVISGPDRRFPDFPAYSTRRSRDAQGKRTPTARAGRCFSRPCSSFRICRIPVLLFPVRSICTARLR